MLLHQLQVLIPRFLSVRLEDTAGYEVTLHPSIIPSGVDVILGVVESLPCTIGTSRKQTRNRVGNRVGERRTGVLVSVIVVLGEEDQLLPGSFRFYDPLLEKEFTEARFVPGLEGGFLDVLEGLLSVAVLFVSPGGVRPPVLCHEVLKVFLRVVEGFWDINLVLLEPGL